METRRTKKDDWMKLPSKSRPGRFYLFNKTTGETQWIPVAQESSSAEVTTKGSKKDSPPKFQVSKLRSKTPAQDRLKRLQNNLKVSQIRGPPSKANTENIKKNVLDSKEQKNDSCNTPSTSSATKSNPKCNALSVRKLPSPKRINERSISNLNSPPTDLEIVELPTPNTNRLNTSLPSASNKEFDTSIYSCESSTSEDPHQTTKRFKKDDFVSSTLNSLRTGIVNKIKEICKMPFTTTSTKPPDDIHQAKEPRSSLNLINTTSFKPNKKTKNNTQHLTASLQEALSQLRAEKETSLDNNAQCSTPKNLNVPNYQRGSANSRLERLRQSLQLQQPSTSATGAATLSLIFAQPTLTSTKPPSTLIGENNNLKLPTAAAFNTNLGISTNSMYQTLNNSINDEVEAMDWQPSIKQEVVEISSSDCIVSNKFQRPSLKKFGSGDAGTMGDIYDTVNGNLLRFSSEKQKGSLNNTNKWQKEFYYFVVDTNVLLRDLCFIDDLSEMKLCDTKGSMLYIPYCVLQELDKLKMRSGCQEGVKTLAVRAIKYLNSKFENKSKHLQAQSALEERHHLVDINSADDSIINCCLQAKDKISNLLLLTEDVNLRNKAICNSILVSTKSDLVSKHYDISDVKEKS